MDFELWYLILVPLLFAAGWFARSFDIKEKQTIANEKDTLYKGVDLLLSNKQDQAIDAFINLVKLDPDTVEMHFLLRGFSAAAENLTAQSRFITSWLTVKICRRRFVPEPSMNWAKTT